MALEGSLRDFGLADILQLLYFQKKTGTLTISSPADRVALYFYEGNIVAADSRKRAEENRFGRILIKRGVIKEKDLQEALQEQKKTGQRIGDILAKKGLVSDEVVKEAITSQLKETVIQLFSWKEGNYEFRAQQVSLSKEIPIVLDTQHLLMEGLRILDEWTLIEGRLTLDTVFRRTGIEGFSLGPEEETILRLVDGENDVSMIIDLSQMDNFEASKTLVSLMDKGLIEPVTVEPLITEPQVPLVRQKDFSLLYPLGLFILAVIVSLSVTLFKNEDIFSQWVRSSKEDRVADEIEKMRFQAELFKQRNGSYPSSLEHIGRTRDIWGNPYYYQVNNEGLLIISPGPDRKIGTSDDIY